MQITEKAPSNMLAEERARLQAMCLALITLSQVWCTHSFQRDTLAGQDLALVTLSQCNITYKNRNTAAYRTHQPGTHMVNCMAAKDEPQVAMMANACAHVSIHPVQAGCLQANAVAMSCAYAHFFPS